MNILVTGGAGYIGSIVAEELLKAGHTITVYDSLVHGHSSALPAGAQLVQGDIAHEDVLNQVMRGEGFDAVMHFAAFIEAGESMRKPGRFFRNNVMGSLNLVEAAIAHSIPRFVFSSSAGVYASSDAPLVEEDRLGPSSVYGQTKLMVEQVLRWYSQIYDLSYAALRYFNAAGASPTGERGEDHDPETHLIPLTLQVALGQRDKITIFGDDYPTRDGTCVRDYIHVVDLAHAHILALEALDQGSHTYNLGNGRGFTVKEVIETCRQVTGHPIPAQIGERRPGDAPILIASSDGIREELGWEPQYPDLRTIVAHAWQWHRRHPRGYED
jgi:UDP-glucose 4-epimerase